MAPMPHLTLPDLIAAYLYTITSFHSRGRSLLLLSVCIDCRVPTCVLCAVYRHSFVVWLATGQWHNWSYFKKTRQQKGLTLISGGKPMVSLLWLKFSQPPWTENDWNSGNASTGTQLTAQNPGTMPRPFSIHSYHFRTDGVGQEQRILGTQFVNADMTVAGVQVSEFTTY